MSVITDALTGLSRGERTIDEVETLFRQHEWPPRESEPPKTFNELMEQADRDAVVAADGTWVEVEMAYTDGTITHEQYTHLARVVADVVAAQREEDDG
jgi:hypothetical protein